VEPENVKDKAQICSRRNYLRQMPFLNIDRVDATALEKTLLEKDKGIWA
jgi:hypothetical protein